MSGYLRGEIAKLANVNVETLRYYENRGLIPSPIRSESGYRLYSEEMLSELRTNLQAENKHPELQATLQVLHMEP